MYWKTKARVFRALSIVPMGDQIHYLLQRKVTKELPRRPEYIEDLLVAAQKLYDDVSCQLAVNLPDARFVEIGAGRDLAVAIALRMLGVGHVTCIDITRLAKLDLIQHAAKHMALLLDKPIPEIGTWESLENYGISYRAPNTLHEAELPTNSIDCFFSIDTLEHIPRERLVEILNESRRILKSNGISVHFVDYSDHYARGCSLSRFNFLKFTAAEWAPYNSRFHYVNRLRHSEFLEIFNEQRFEIIAAAPDIEPAQNEILTALAPEFRGFTEQDLFTIRAKIIARPMAT